MKAREDTMKAQNDKLVSEINERDSVIVDMKERLECEQTD